jgi:hypothetical protein
MKQVNKGRCNSCSNISSGNNYTAGGDAVSGAIDDPVRVKTAGRWCYYWHLRAQPLEIK